LTISKPKRSSINYIYTAQAAECDARDPARPGYAAATLYPPMLPAGWIL
jgi:hypothetical protein